MGVNYADKAVVHVSSVAITVYATVRGEKVSCIIPVKCLTFQQNFLI